MHRVRTDSIWRALVAGCAILLGAHAGAAPGNAEPLFRDDFSGGLDRWAFPNTDGARIVEYAPEEFALELRTVRGQMHALVRGSEAWGDVRIEGRVQFPEDTHNYLGFVYGYGTREGRTDFESLYIKGNGSYVQANPHHDTNVGRTLYPEGRTELTGARAIVIGAWHDFALEIVGHDAHLYVSDMQTPAFVYRGRQALRGAFGFKPRNPGGAVLLDDVSVRRIQALRYAGPPIPDPAYDRTAYVTRWQVLGPLARNLPARLEGTFEADRTYTDAGEDHRWRPLEADARGAVVTASVTEHRGPRRVAYFRSELHSEGGGAVELRFSSVDDLAIWVNGVYAGFLGRQRRAWWDSAHNPERRIGRRTVQLRPGANDLVVRIAGGTYATGGFFLSTATPQ